MGYPLAKINDLRSDKTRVRKFTTQFLPWFSNIQLSGRRSSVLLVNIDSTFPIGYPTPYMAAVNLLLLLMTNVSIPSHCRSVAAGGGGSKESIENPWNRL